MSATTVGGGVVHPLRTPKGVDKYWNKDDAVAAMEAGKSYRVPGLHEFFCPELETERSTARSTARGAGTARSPARGAVARG